LLKNPVRNPKIDFFNGLKQGIEWIEDNPDIPCTKSSITKAKRWVAMCSEYDIDCATIPIGVVNTAEGTMEIVLEKGKHTLVLLFDTISVAMMTNKTTPKNWESSLCRVPQIEEELQTLWKWVMAV
jgi:hypothetical protein